MLQILKYIQYIPALIIVVQAAVSLVESIKAHAPGEEKKNDVLTALKGAWDKISADFGIKVSFETLAPIIGILIDLSVAVYNLVGFFAKKDQPA